MNPGTSGDGPRSRFTIDVKQAALGYVAAAWVAVQVLDILGESWGIGLGAVRLVQIGIGIGFVVVVGAIAVRDRFALPRVRSGVAGRRNVGTVGGWVLALILLISLGMTIARSNARVWARTVAIPDARSLLLAHDFAGAMKLAQAAVERLPGDPSARELLESTSAVISIATEPAGASIDVKEYAAPDSEWRPVGVSPVVDLRVPLGTKQIRARLAGYETVLLVPLALQAVELVLRPAGSSPEGMVHVPEGLATGWTVETGANLVLDLPEHFYDRYEVTNAEFAGFARAGGYSDPDNWEPLAEHGLTPEIRASFVDATGRPGPAEWELGAPVPGTEGLAVSGVSWYEALAYCRSVGKTLPTLYHWGRSSGVMFTSGDVADQSNFASEGLRPAAQSRSVGSWGVHDLAGNAREWVWNEAPGGRLILGGGWNDPAYSFTHAQVADPADRSDGNGFRCVLHPQGATVDPRVWEPVQLSMRDYYAEAPVSDEVFEFFQRQFLYDAPEMDARLEDEGVLEGGIRWELVSYASPYEGSRGGALVLLPAGAPAPVPAVVVFPGSLAPLEESVLVPGLEDAYDLHWIARTGRGAVVFPILKGTWSRQDGLPSTWPSETPSYTEYVTRWVQDVSRAIDYLETRGDIDAGSLGYFGYSWGGRMGPIILATEPRFDLGMLISGGLAHGRGLPEVDQINYVTRVTQPVLMLNGLRDSVEDYETAQRPMFDLLGTPPEHKRHETYPTGHITPRTATIREMADWLDRYLGPRGP